MNKLLTGHLITPKGRQVIALALPLMFTLIHSLPAIDVPPLKVAFVVTSGANVMDLAGPWEVFQDTMTGDRMPFQLFTVSDTTRPVEMTGGFRTAPHHTFADAPHPDIIVVGAQKGSARMREWLRSRASDSRVVMSVCTGAFKLAEAGLLDGKKAITHHEYWDSFAEKFPRVPLERGSRFVQFDEKLYTAGGLTSGIDLALAIVEKFYGREVADRTAAYMEYQREPDSSSVEKASK